MKRYIKYLIIMFLFVFVTNTTMTAQAAVKINKSEKTIYAGETYKLKVSGTKKTVKWSSSKKSIATVDANGKVTAKKAGTATITAKVGKQKYKCVITVKKVGLNETKLTLNKGNKSNLKLEGTKAISWKSSNKSVVSVDKKGKITAKKFGSATISVDAKNGKTYKCKVNVIEVTDTTDTEKEEESDIEPTPTNPTHTHNYVLFETVEPTCTEDGYKTYRCTCRDSYTETNEKLGHNYVSKIIAPTCTEQGFTLYNCTRCGDSYKDNYTKALGHDYVLTNTVEPTCTADGYKEYKCSRSGDKYKETIPALGHNYVSEVVAPTCEEQGYTLYTCTRDGSSYKDEYTEKLGHDWDTGVVDVEATDTSLGYKIYTCKQCGEKVKMPYALGHEVQLTGGETAVVYGYWDVEMADEIFTMLNEYRVENGLAELLSEESVNEYATMRALELAYLYGHVRPNGVLTDLGENINYGCGSAFEYMKAWKESKGHNDTMLDDGIKYGAVGIFVGIIYGNSDGARNQEFSNETPEYGVMDYAVQNFSY